MRVTGTGIFYRAQLQGQRDQTYFLDRARLHGDMTLRRARSEVLELLATRRSKLAAAVTSCLIAQRPHGLQRSRWILFGA